MVRAMTSDYGNTSSRHLKGVEAEAYVKEAREEIAKSLKAKEKIFHMPGWRPHGNIHRGSSVHGLKNRENAPHIVSAGFEGIRAEVLLHALEERGIYVSSGSACSSNHPGVSGTLKGYNVGSVFTVL